MDWRVRLDVPYEMAVVPPYMKATHAADFRPVADSFYNTWREPARGIVMLRPSFLDSNYASHFRALSAFHYAAAAWRETQIGAGVAPHAATVQAAGETDHSAADLSLSYAFMQVPTNPAQGSPIWVLETNAPVPIDGSFALYPHVIANEIEKLPTFFAIRWDDLAIHVSGSGYLTAARYPDQGDLTQEPNKDRWHEQIALPEELNGKRTMFAFIPVPGVGLLVYFTASPVRPQVLHTNTTVATVRGMVIPRGMFASPGGAAHIMRESKVAICVDKNLAGAAQFGFADVSFASSGTYTDACLDMGFRPVDDTPAIIAPILSQNGQASVTASLRDSLNAASWAATAGPQARVKLALSTSDTRYSPFVTGYGFRFAAHMDTHNRTAITPKWYSLELMTDHEGRQEGRCELELRNGHGAGEMAIGERGDTTFVLEGRIDAGSPWLTYLGGVACDFELDLLALPATGEPYYRGTCCLRDMWDRFREVNQNLQTAYDFMRVSDAVNVTLKAGSFAEIADGDMPDELKLIMVPGCYDGQSWQFAPRAGDDGQKVMNALLTMARTQANDWIAQYAWDSGTWGVGARLHDSSAGATWRLVPFVNDTVVADRVAGYQSCRLKPQPPEANIVRVIGYTTPDASGDCYASQPLYNQPSIDDVNSPDYLGRTILAFGVAYEVNSQKEVNLYARRLYDAVAKRRLYADVRVDTYVAGLLPNTHVQVEDADGVVRLDGWIKRRTLSIGRDGPKESMQLYVDSAWAGDMQ